MSGRPKMCPSCGKLMGIGNECPYCGADARSVGSRIKSVSRAVSQGDNGTPATFVLMVVIVGVYLASIAFGGLEESGGGIFGMLAPRGEVQEMLGAMFSSLVDNGEWWRLVTAIFLHGGIFHLLMNSLFLWWLGRPYEEEVGAPSMVTLFILAGIVGFVFSYAFGGGNSLGASGGGFGLVGAIIGRRYSIDRHFRDPRTLRAIELAFLNLVLGFLMTGIDNLAHIGGLVTGLGLGFVQARVASPRLWLGAAGALVALTLTSAALAFVNRVDSKAVEATWSCARIADEAVAGQSDAIDVDRAESALACFEQTNVPGVIEDDIAAMRGGLRDAVKGRTSGSFSSEREGINRYVEARMRFDRWLRARYR